MESFIVNVSKPKFESKLNHTNEQEEDQARFWMIARKK